MSFKVNVDALTQTNIIADHANFSAEMMVIYKQFESQSS